MQRSLVRQRRRQVQRPVVWSVMFAVACIALPGGGLSAGEHSGANDPGGGFVAGASASERFAHSLTDVSGDVERGRAVAFDRERGNCIVCHAIPAPDMAYHGNLGPSLAGIGGRRRPAELRMRLVDSRLIDPRSLMPPYHSTGGLVRVGERYAGRPVLTAQEIEDVIAFVSSLRN